MYSKGPKCLVYKKKKFLDNVLLNCKSLAKASIELKTFDMHSLWALWDTFMKCLMWLAYPWRTCKAEHEINQGEDEGIKRALLWFEWNFRERIAVLYRCIRINSCLRGLIQSLVLAFILPALAWARVEQHLLELQHSRSDPVVCLELKLILQILQNGPHRVLLLVHPQVLAQQGRKWDWFLQTWQLDGRSGIEYWCALFEPEPIILCNFDASLIVAINWGCFQLQVTKIFR